MITLDRANQIFAAEGLGPQERLVWLYLAHCANVRTGRCDPSTAAIVRATGVSKRSVHRAIETLASAGMLTVRHCRGRGQTNRYALASPAVKCATPAHFEPEAAPENVPDRAVKCAKSTPENVPQWHKELRSELGRNREAQPRAREASPDEQEGANPSAGAIPETAGAVPHPEGAVPHKPGAVRAEPGADPDQTTRERLLAAMGAPQGIAGPSAMLGGVTDMAEAAKWRAMGISLDDQCRLIAERVAKGRARSPSFTVSRFAYFTAAMAELAEARKAPPRASPSPQASSGFDEAFLRRVAGA